MDDVDAELVRLALWALFAAATSAGHADYEDAIIFADRTLEGAQDRFPFLVAPPPPDPTGGLLS